MNGDASADAVVQNSTTGAILYADMKGGVFQQWGVVNQNLTSDWVAIGAGDLNGDGFADVVVQQQSTGTTLWANMANGAFAGWGVVSNTLTPNWKAKGVADLTGDGFAEVIFQHTPGGAGVNPGTTYYTDMKTGTAQWGVVTSSVTAQWLVQGTADVDNDGSADVLFQHSASGAALYADMNAGAFAGWGVVNQNITAEWQVV